jgi:hypothetical protein
MTRRPAASSGFHAAPRERTAMKSAVLKPITSQVTPALPKTSSSWTVGRWKYWLSAMPAANRLRKNPSLKTKTGAAISRRARVGRPADRRLTSQAENPQLRPW